MTMTREDLLNQDLNHLWHPCSQMKDYTDFAPLIVSSAAGSYIELNDGRRLIDAISSWWCKSLGHNHPRLKQALLRQIEHFEHVILSNTTNETIVKLSEKIARLTTSLNKVFYAGDGACAVEIALKMSLHARQIQGQPARRHFVSLQNSYHGETIGALSVSDLGIYREPYQALLFDNTFLQNIPYVSSIDDPLWHNCDSHWPAIEAQLTSIEDSITAIVVEPIVQGAGGMKIYSQDFLRRLRAWTQARGIHLIADEIMTGIGRTGKMLGCQHAGIEPDFLCLGKGITGGWLPMSVVATSDAIYDLFYDDYRSGKSFLHSHTFSGNPMAASVALETLQVMEDDNICNHVTQVGPVMHKAMLDIANETGKLANVRSIGGLVAADLISDDPNRRLGFEVFQAATKLGAYLRPLGNTIYWCPPLNIDLKTIESLREITQKAIQKKG
jgi:adenosylmethionine---8-amino-7-oxononanoate aminotransferase